MWLKGVFGRTLRMRYSRLLLWSMGLTNGHGYHLSYRGNLLNNANKDGINGWTLVSKKYNGPDNNRKNYYIWLGSSPVNGEPSLPLLEEHLLSAIKNIKNC